MVFSLGNNLFHQHCTCFWTHFCRSFLVNGSHKDTTVPTATRLVFWQPLETAMGLHQPHTGLKVFIEVFGLNPGTPMENVSAFDERCDDPDGHESQEE